MLLQVQSSKLNFRPRTALACILAFGAAFAFSGLTASQAEAAFTTGKCQGDAITGGGASFANTAHNSGFIPSGWPSYCSDIGSQPSVTYLSLGSGCGRYFVGARGTCTGYDSNADGSKSRTNVPRFGMSDEPLTATTQAQINGGSDAVGDEGLIRTIPMAMGAIAVAVNTPNGCSITTKPGSADVMATTGAGAFTADQQKAISNFGSANANTARLQLTRAQLEAAMNGGAEMNTWGELVPWINDGNGTASEAADVRCQDHPIFRVRRLDDGGTPFVLKDYLNKINPSRGWLSTYVAPDSRTWPNQNEVVAFDIDNDGTAGAAEAVTKCAAQTPQAPAGIGASGIGCFEDRIPTLQSTEIAP